jgi:hypothetical protein
MSEAFEFPGKVVRAAAGFHTDQAGRQIREESEKLGSLDLLTQDRSTVAVNAVNLENIFRQIDADRGHIHGRALLVVGCCLTRLL